MAPTRAELEHREHCVYVMWRDEVPLYVGMTCNYDQRLRGWGVFSPGLMSTGWPGTVTHVDVWEVGPGRTHAEGVERDTIVALDPLHNCIHSPREAERMRLWEWYSEWAHAYRQFFYDHNAYGWAMDQAVADERCAAVGLVAPRIDEYLIERKEAHRRAVFGITDVTAVTS